MKHYSRIYVAATAATYIFLLFSSGSVGAAPTPADDYVCDAGKVCRSKDTQLPLRALLRPHAAVREAANEASAPQPEQTPFTPWYVFERQGIDLSDADHPKGWYRISRSAQPDAKAPSGWVQARDAFEWKSALVVSYRDPGLGSDKRGRVLMFDDPQKLHRLVTAADGSKKAKAIEADVDAGKDVDTTYGVVMAEPKNFLDIYKSFYILPVLKYEPIPGLSRDARYLQVAAAIPQTTSETGHETAGAATLKSPEMRKKVNADLDGQGLAAPAGQPLLDAKHVQIDIKFVLDMTDSTQPYLDATREAVNQIATEIEQKFGKDVEFGLVGYRDIPAQCGGCSFTPVRNFTPQSLVSSDDLTKLLQQPDARAEGGGDWPEDVYDGVVEAAQSYWRPETIHCIIQVGDASSHEAGEQGYQYTARTTRDILAANAIYLDSLHVHYVGPTLAGFITADFPIAQQQFKTLSENAQGISAYSSVDVDPTQRALIGDKMLTALRASTKTFLDTLDAAHHGGLAGEIAKVEKARAEHSKPGAVESEAKLAADAARETLVEGLIEYLGRRGQRPNDLVAWVADIDLTDQSRDALDVRVLVSRSELDELIKLLKDLQQASVTGKATDKSMFEALQTIVTGTTLDRLSQMASGGDTKKMAALSGLLPSWISSLPYTSELQRMTFDDYDRLTADDKVKFETDLSAKITLYSTFANNATSWQKLSPTSGDLDDVMPVLLSDLP